MKTKFWIILLVGLLVLCLGLSLLLLTPGHCCSTVNLHDKIYVVDGDRVIARIPVTARGCGK